MLLTPTYHVFDLYKGHQNATLLQSSVETETIGTETYAIPDLHISASEDDAGVIHITLANLSLDTVQDISCQVDGKSIQSIEARILTGAMDARNDFDALDRVKPQDFADITIENSHLQFQIPPCAVMEISLGQ